ncbi:type III secretion system chaperone [Estrella lausannensis]|uniref:Putative type III secretion chaperone SycE n=1 Tax=Estrella lausannensis TaxID=483423 RepID=A0A0H5DNC1_9BACT|nr:type III secretion system chaperone [Estrella lausannensis]CRX37652.1 putative type III secretion chaperone SycE [Estrella lausannensis]
MDLKEAVNGFLRSTGGYPIQSDDPIIKVQINNETVLAFEESLEPDKFYLFAVLDSLPHGGELEVALEALSSNLFGQETGSATIGYDKDTRSLVLFQRAELTSMDDRKMKELITSFLAELSYLKTKFQELGTLTDLPG